MKQRKQKLLALLMAFVMVLSLAPSAWAVDRGTSGTVVLADGTPEETTAAAPEETTAAPVTTTEAPETTTEPAETTTEPAETTTEPAVTTTEPAVTTTEPAVTTTEPAVTTTEPAETTTEPAETTTENGYDIVISGGTSVAVGSTLQLYASVRKDGQAIINQPTITWSVSNLTSTSVTTAVATVSESGVVRGVSTGTATITASCVVGGQRISKDVSITVGNSGFRIATSSSYTSVTLSGYLSSATLYAYLDGVLVSDGQNVSWSIYSTNGGRYIELSSRTGSSITVRSLQNTLSGGVIVRATYGGRTAEFTVYVNYSSEINVSAVIYDSNPGYALTDKPDEGTSSIADQIDDWVRKNYYNYSSTYYRDYRVHVNGGTAYESGNSNNRGTLTTSSSWHYSNDLDNIIFTPVSSVTTSNGSYRVSFSFEVEIYRDSYNTAYRTVQGTMTFTVKQGYATGDIFYSAAKGANVTLELSKFRSFWTDYQSRGSLAYITINSVTGGRLYSSSGKAISTGDKLYVSPTSSQTGLDGLYFTPTSASTSSGKVAFTANGSSSGSGSSLTRKGTVSISFLTDAAGNITYNTGATGTVNLYYNDFIDAYKAATGNKSTPSNLSIEFQSVPSVGTLSYKTTSSSTSSTKLTSSNIKGKKFNAKSSGSNRIDDVTYTTSNTRTETISYIGYIGSNASFTGEITFNGTGSIATDVSVTYTCLSTTGVALTPTNFTSAHSVMSNASYVILGVPQKGRLDYSATAANSAVLITQLGTVSYIPNGSVTSDRDSFVFTAYNSANQEIAKGTVTVVISLPANTARPGAITSINQFTPEYLLSVK